MRVVKLSFSRLLKTTGIISLIFVGLSLSGCSEGKGEKDIKIAQLEAELKAVNAENSKLRVRLDEALEKVGDLREGKGKGQLESAQKVWPWFIFILLLVVVGFVLHLLSANKKRNEDKKSSDDTIRNLKLSNEESVATINKLVNDIERLKQLNEEGERNQVVTQIKESSSRRVNSLKKIGGQDHGRSN